MGEGWATFMAGSGWVSISRASMECVCVCVCHSPEHQVAWGCTYVSVAGWCFVDCPVGIAVMSLCITTTLQYTDF